MVQYTDTNIVVGNKNRNHKYLIYNSIYTIPISKTINHIL